MPAYYIVPDQVGQRVVLIGLAVAWAGLLFGGLLFRRSSSQIAASHEMVDEMDIEPPRDIPIANRMLSSLTLVLAGWAWLFIVRDTLAVEYALLIAVGMTCGFLGDVALANLVRLPHPLLWGMGLFGVGHICYMVAIVRLAMRSGLDAAGPRWIALGFWLLLSVMGWFFVVQRNRPRTMLRLAALPYALLLGSFVGVTMGVAVQDARFVLLALGSVLFWVSDLLLAGEQFGEFRSRVAGNAIWLTYGPAQALIVYSVGSVVAVVR